MDVLLYDVMHIFRKESVDAVSSFLADEEKEKMPAIIQKLIFYNPINAKASRRRIADKLIEYERSNF